jgi:purine-binding chemotaxis protein CheW
MPGGQDSNEGFLREFFYDPEEEGDLLPVLVSEADLAEAAPAVQQLEGFLSFRLDAEDYAIEIGEIYEIVRLTPLTEVPRTPKAILGVISLRGEAVPVFDLQRMLGTEREGHVSRLPPASGSTRVVILQTEKGLAGILVDAVDQVVRLPRESIEAPPRGLVGSSAGSALKGIGRWQGRLLAILDPRELMQPERRR